ncbi:MAG: L-threonylcarbamoyladenylate synthase [Spirochaetes bacterium]|nr:L-threonylcarbamoyladenylate synthase [Spirochaetota bacterium]
MLLFEIHEKNPQKRLINKIVDELANGAVMIYPTDTVYAYGCDILQKSAIERIYAIKKIPKNKPLSFIFSDIAQLHMYARNIPDRAFKIMKKVFPGPYTFIFKASKAVPKIAITNQKTIGVRVPNNEVALELVRTLGRPILSAGVNLDDGTYIIEPTSLNKQIRNEVDIIINCGPKISEPSTIIDFTEDEPKIIRMGKGPVYFL